MKLGRGKTRPSDIGGVARKIMTQGFLNWLWPHFTESDLEKIIKNHGNEEAQLNILSDVFKKANLPDSFDPDIYRHECLDLLLRIERKAGYEMPEVVSARVYKYLGIKPRTISKKAKKKIVIKTKKIFKQKSKKGKTYQRTYMRWSKTEELALKVRLRRYGEGKETIKNLKKILTQLTGVSRSEASIKRKISRLSKTKKN